MLKNESNIDRSIRIIVGLALALYAYINLTGVVQVTAYVVSVVLIFTSLTGFCLIYKILNISTDKKTKRVPDDEKVIESDDQKPDLE